MDGVTSRSASRRRIVFLDVDGTILEHGRQVATSTVEAVRAAREHGHLVYLCTGRAAAEIPAQVVAIGFDGAISNGGVTATTGDEIVVSRVMPTASVRRLVGTLERYGLEYVLQADDEVFATPGIAELLRDYVRSLREDGPEDSLVGIENDYRDVSAAPIDAIGKAVFMSRDSGDLERLQTELGDEFHVVPGSIPMPGGSNGEICLRGTNKGSAIELVLARLGIDAADAIGIGDSWNDVEMFQVCGVAVAMGNAEPELKRLADRVTTSVSADGVWTAFRDLGLLDPVT